MDEGDLGWLYGRNSTRQEVIMSLYVGVRIEISNRTLKIKDLADTYNNTNSMAKIFDVHDNGRIAVEKSKDMLIARGKQEDRVHTGLINFSLMLPIETTEKEIERIVKIVNVLGNDRLIRERVKTFVLGQSALNKMPEFAGLTNVFKNMNSFIPNFTAIAWYYAPEVKFK